MKLNGPFLEYITSRRTHATRETYSALVRRTVGDPDAFLDLARRDRRAAEDSLVRSLIERRSKVAATSLSISVSTVKSFLDYYEMPLNWKRIRSVVPVARSVARDRAPSLEEVRSALKLASPREKLAVLIMASGGLRVGALSSMKLKDVEFLPSGVARLTVYAGDSEQYPTFITPEAVEALKDYLSARERIGEKLTPQSWLFRDKWDYQGQYTRVQRVVADIASPVKVEAIANSVRRLWQRTGARKVGDSRPFKADHGFRKLFKTSFPACPIHGDLDKEVLLGHYLSYHKPTPEHLEEVYLKAVPSLSIDERFKLREEIAVKEEEHAQAWKDMRLEVLTLKDENKELQKNQTRIFELLEKGAKVDPRLLGISKEDVGLE